MPINVRQTVSYQSDCDVCGIAGAHTATEAGNRAQLLSLGWCMDPSTGKTYCHVHLPNCEPCETLGKAVSAVLVEPASGAHVCLGCAQWIVRNEKDDALFQPLLLDKVSKEEEDQYA